MNFIGHRKQRKLLEEIANSDRIPHNLLFIGPEAIGKKRVAEEFIKLINCENKNCCGECDSCRQLKNGRHPDFLMISGEKEIKIDQIRELQKKLSLTGRTKDSFKAAIIDQAHLLNSQAQASLLKTLEEPKGNALIILITEYPNLLLDTILSRSWPVKFSAVKTNLIEKELVKRGADKKTAEELSKLSFSRPGLAIKLFESKSFKKKWLQKKKDLEELRKATYSDRFDYIKKLSDNREEAEETLKIWLSFFRKELIEGKMKNVEPMEEIMKILFLISKTNVNLKLSLERVIINL